MPDWVECVPNVSEGRSPSVLRCMQSAIRESGATLLDTQSDCDHHRSVFTFAAPLEHLAASVVSLAQLAVERIDLSTHRGLHPRVGAIDVVPLVPLAEASRQACVDSARVIAERLWAELHVPVYLYGDAATCIERRKLEAIRKLGLDALATSVRSGERLPDVGGPDLHPTAGACCVGVRDFLAAFNVQIAGENATVAKRIARAVRESTGGLPGVKALGLYLESQRVAQVSMNVTDLGQLSLDTVYSAVCREADRAGTQVLGSELVGLVPRRALGPHPERLGIQGFHDGMILENRLEDARLQRHAVP